MSLANVAAYTTIDAALGDGVDVELEIRRSRFLTRLRRVATEESAREVIQQQKKAHFDAAHNCSAFVLGRTSEITRSSDDGEPSGTAGVLMLGVLLQSGLTEVVAVVTRYFGGIKLGAGGLVRAYSDAVAQAVQAAGRRTVASRVIAHVEVPLAEAGQMEQAMRALVLPSGAKVGLVGTVWGEHATMALAVPEAGMDELQAALAGLSSGRLAARLSHQVWVDVSD